MTAGRQTLIPGVRPSDFANGPANARQAPRARRLRVTGGNFAGKSTATITFTPDKFIVRPKGSHSVYVVDLRELAQFVIYKTAVPKR